MNILKIFLGNLMILSFIQRLFATGFQIIDFDSDVLLIRSTMYLLILLIGLLLVIFGIKQEYMGKDRIKMKFCTMLSNVFSFNYHFFFKNLKKERPPYLLLALFIFGSIIIFNIVDSQTFYNGGQLTNWGQSWIMVGVFSLFYGYALYIFLGLIYYLLSKLALGKLSILTTSNVALYALLPVGIFGFIERILYTILFGGSYFVLPLPLWLKSISALIVFVLTLFGIVTIYKVIKGIGGTAKIRSILLFLLLPIIFVFFLLSFTIRQIIYEDNVAENYNYNSIQQMNVQDFSSAEASLKFAINAFKKDENLEGLRTAYFNLASVYQFSGDIESAIAVLSEAIAYVDRNTADYDATAGLISLLNGNVQNSIIQFEASLLKDENNLISNNYLGLIYSGRFGDDYKDFDKGLPFNQKTYEITDGLDYAAIQTLAFNYYELGQFDSAIPLLENAMNLNPDNLITDYIYALTLYKVGNEASSRLILESLIQIDSSFLTEEVKQILGGR